MNRRDFLVETSSLIASLVSGMSGQREQQGQPTAQCRRENISVVGKGSEPDYASLLGQHDIVYLSPVAEGPEGLPIGNGDLVGMVWMPPNGIEVVLNKSDLWDDRPSEPTLAEDWAWDPKEEEQWTALVSAARLRVRSPLPLLETLYLDDFKARLNLYEGRVEVQSNSPVGHLNANCFISKEPGVLVINYEQKSSEAVQRQIELERWGSRRLFHWYSQYDHKATGTGLGGSQAGADRQYIWVEQRLRAISFAVVARFVGADYQTGVESQHQASMITSRSLELSGQLYVAVVTSEEDSRPLEAARHKIEAAIGRGYSVLVGNHKKQWAEFWSKSYIQIPEEYLENLYYFTLYQLAASSQGSYPPPHCGGFWFWKHDARRWGHYYHWNVQQQYWPVHASNHGELALPYFEFRYRTMPEAEKYARNVHKRGGVFYSDVTDRWGRGTVSHDVTNILTAGPQISMDFWRHYLYTQDREFLRTRAYPHMKATAQFYLDTLEKDAQGTYHVPQSTAYENWTLQRGTITDLASIRQAFPVTIKASEILGLDETLRERWREVANNLVGFTILDNVIDENGKKLPKVFSSGIPLEESFAGPDVNFHWRTKRMVRKGERQFNIAFLCELAPVFPSGVVGLAHRGTELFEAARGTVLGIGTGPSYISVPIVAAARLGMKEEVLAQLVQMVRNWQRFPQGFFVEASTGSRPDDDYSPNRWAMNAPYSILDGRRTEERGFVPSRWFDMPDLEVGGILMTTLNEMLLQSYDGIIRIFPSTPDSWQDVAFKLRAVGAFLITGERQKGEVRPFLVESLMGGPCRIENPWPGERIRVRDLPTGRLLTPQDKGGLVTFQTDGGASYLVFRAEHPETPPQALAPRRAQNVVPKEWVGRRLGLPQYF